jgi:hypothetical protein
MSAFEHCEPTGAQGCSEHGILDVHRASSLLPHARHKQGSSTRAAGSKLAVPVTSLHLFTSCSQCKHSQNNLQPWPREFLIFTTVCFQLTGRTATFCSCRFDGHILSTSPRRSNSTYPPNMTSIQICSRKTWRGSRSSDLRRRTRKSHTQAIFRSYNSTRHSWYG